ncbi:MAG: glycosyltransferase family 39 protein [Candidatus Omnitrophota bacterium]|nr:MAG: glycosyltransferase family 39 protein [Candidatus Omnitrophota bacterium]
MKTSAKGIILFLVLVFFILSLYSWKAKILFNPDELFYYKSSQTFSELKDLYAPKYYGEHRFQKPPLFYLSVFLFFKLFGVNWFSARLVTIFSSILVLVMTYLLGLKMFDRKKAFFGTAVLATSILFFRFGRIALPEMTFVFFMTAAVYFAYSAFLENKRKFFYLSFLFMGIGSLVKGPVAFLIPGLTILIFQIINRKKVPSLSIPWIGGVFIILGLNLLWLIPTFLIYGKSFLHMATFELGNKLRENIHFYNIGEQAWHYFQKFSFYIPVIFALYLPWSILEPIALVIARKRLEKKLYFTQRSFLLIWFMTGFLLFTAVSTKRYHYVLSLFPALSLYLISFFNFEKGYIKKVFQGLLSMHIAGYLFTVILIFPLLSIDGVDRLSTKLATVLKTRDAPVAVSWRLDPQEIELYINRRVFVMWESHLANWRRGGGPKIGHIIPKSKKDAGPFYLMLAREEYDRFVSKTHPSVKGAAKSPVDYSKLSEDWRWRKTIKFKNFFDGLLKNPKMVKSHFKDGFQEEVLLLLVWRK